MTAIILDVFATMPARGDRKPDVVERLRIALREIEQSIVSGV